MLRQISSVVQDEISEMSEPDVISQSPQLKYVLYCYAAKMLSLLLCFASLFFLLLYFICIVTVDIKCLCSFVCGAQDKF